MFRCSLVIGLLALVPLSVWADGNRLTYLDTLDPYYPHKDFPKLTTPMWVGEPGVEAVVILAIDDMREHPKYEAFLRPILNRLKKIDGRAPVSIMTNRIDPKEPHLQTWLKEGVNIDIHTYDHPCPFFKKASFAEAKETYDKCVDLMHDIPNNRPVAFRMPCCDSLNTPSPRFWAEIFNKTTAKGKFLTIDSSVFLLLTPNDPELPRELVLTPDGTERFRKYMPKDRTFVNTIEDYPYPYVIGRLCWEFPCMAPSDWEAQHLQKPNNPQTVRDWEAALDAVVTKQGVFTMVFHPHNWIKNEQIVELIDYADRKYGKKVKFLNFAEAEERLNKNLLAGEPIRHPKSGMDNGVRMLELNGDGYLDVVIGNDDLKRTRIWSPKQSKWIDVAFPKTIDDTARFGILQLGASTLLSLTVKESKAWRFDGKRWVDDSWLLNGLKTNRVSKREKPLSPEGRGKPEGAFAPEERVVTHFLGTLLRDLDGDGRCELIVSNSDQQAIYEWFAPNGKWTKFPFTLPTNAMLVDKQGKDNGLRFIDLNEDGKLDLIFSNETDYGIYLFTDMKSGWSQKVMAGKQGEAGALPMIARKGTNNGFWVHSRSLWWSNEDTALLKDHVDRRSFNELLKDLQPGPRSPAAGLKSMKVRPGFQVEQVAAEPLLMDPVAYAWGPDGKFWVVEMADYPLGIDGKGKFGGRVKFLEDNNGDGKYDRATLFLDGIGYPSGVMPYAKGVLVSCAPDIFYAEDSDGDGKADKKDILYTGFKEGNQQHRVNGFAWGLDNWIYLANGDSGGQIKSLKTGKVVEIGGRDLRIRPWDGSAEAVTGQTQFGRNRDDWGNWFGGNNSNPMWHFVLEDHYLKRNPNLAPPNLRIPVSVTPGNAPVYPISATLARFNDFHTLNKFTSACSPIVYRDELFGPAFANNTFVSEPVHNLVHREVMTAKGITFTSSRAEGEQTSEFLASSDNWFRPAMLRTGPDGALWVADMYRHVIEHPQWIPKDWQAKLDLRAGHDMGRIYRVYPVGVKPRAIPNLAKLTSRELVAALDSPSGWQRDMVQQMLIERGDRGAIKDLTQIVIKSKRPLARLHALCTLDGLGGRSPVLLLEALEDPHPGVRKQALRLFEPILRAKPNLIETVLPLLDDPDPQVRLQLVYSLGESKSPLAAKALGQLAVKHAGDDLLLVAWMSSINNDNFEGTLQEVFAAGGAPPEKVIAPLLRMAAAQQKGDVLARLLHRIGATENGAYADWQFAALAGLLDYLDQKKSNLANLGTQSVELSKGIGKLGDLLKAGRTIAADDKAPLTKRQAAIRLLGRGFDQQEEDKSLLTRLLQPQQPVEIQEAALATVGRLRFPTVPQMVLKEWKGFSPKLRGQALDLLLERPDYVGDLLDALERKAVLPQELDATRRQRLLEHPSKLVRDRAAKLLQVASDVDRQKILDSLRPVLDKTGDRTRGVMLFQKNCAACHKLQNIGQDIGPDLASLKDRSRQTLLEAVIDPNKAVETKYVNYTALAKDGRIFTGMIANESTNGITLVGVDGKEKVLLRADLEQLVSSGKSVMPEGLEKDLSLQDLADLLAFVEAGSPQVKEAPKK
jgi:putative membrane-bound dehydrogenase-like protein